MRCDHACAHCGSRAARPRPDELATSELFEVAAALIGLGTREVTFIGGEAYLHPELLALVTFMAAAGVRVTMQTGGRGLTPALARRLKAAGMAAVGVSIDGPEDVHDTLRASRGSFKAAIAALHAARDAGMLTTSNIQINRLSYRRLRETLDALLPTGIVGWRAQLTAPMGRAADEPDWILEPWQILEVIDTLAALQLEQVRLATAAGRPARRALNIGLGNNLGYYGPHEQVLRSIPGGVAAHWQGCMAGEYGIGIESDGSVKGCPSLPSAPYVGGNVRDLSLSDIWENVEVMRFTQTRGVEELWGFCGTCMYAEVCMGGCSFTAHTTLGRRGNNPFCYYRAATLKKRGRRERLVQRELAAGEPYDFGRFEILEEDWPAGG